MGGEVTKALGYKVKARGLGGVGVVGKTLAEPLNLCDSSGKGLSTEM